MPFISKTPNNDNSKCISDIRRYVRVKQASEEASTAQLGIPFATGLGRVRFQPFEAAGSGGGTPKSNTVELGITLQKTQVHNLDQ